MRKKLDKELLTRLYVQERKSIFDIAKMYSWPFDAVKDSCIKCGIKLRGRTGYKKINIEKSVLQKLYLKEKRTLRDIADFFSCSPITVTKRCKEYNIPLRRSNCKNIEDLTPALLKLWYVQQGKSTREIASLIGCSRVPVEQRCREFGIPLRDPRLPRIVIRDETLRRLYLTEGRSVVEIAKIVGCCYRTIYNRVKKRGLDDEKKRRPITK